jgi:hypothetical protein
MATPQPIFDRMARITAEAMRFGIDSLLRSLVHLLLVTGDDWNDRMASTM